MRRRRPPAHGRAPDTENVETTNLTVADKWGNVVEYTLTIEQTGGSGIVVPGRGFLLNNELTDFTAVYDPADPNRIEPRQAPALARSRRRSCCSDGKPFLALGSPGGSTIITTVLQMIFNRIDRGMTLPQAIADPRASQRNTADGDRRAGVHRQVRRRCCTPYGHQLHARPATRSPAPRRSGPRPAIEFGPRGLLTAVVRADAGAAAARPWWCDPAP